MSNYRPGACKFTGETYLRIFSKRDNWIFTIKLIENSAL